jgi:gamma-glutamyl-gamma-aminobutyrate hydrolase PuuD
VIFADRHEVKLVPNGAFARILGCETIRVNSLHGQGMHEVCNRIIVEGTAEDGTIEATRIADSPGFAIGVQWHAEYEARSGEPRVVPGVRSGADHVQKGFHAWSPTAAPSVTDRD